MYLLLLFIGIFITLVFLAWYFAETDDSEVLVSVSSVLAAVTAVALIIMSTYICIKGRKGRIVKAQHKALEEVLARRDSMNPIENATLTTKVMEYNMELASVQYSANSSWTSVFYTDDIRNLKPLK